MKLKILLAIAGVSCFILGGLAVTVWAPYGVAGRTTVIQIDEGDGLSRIASKLGKENVIASGFVFKAYSVISGNGKKFRPGSYTLVGKYSVVALIDVLKRGVDRMIRITIPEGYRLLEIETLLKNAGIKNRGEYLSWSQNLEYIRSLDLPMETNSLEGFLFPDTYLFSEFSSEQQILREMTRNFLRKIPSDYETMAQNVGLNFYEAITLASIIEKETGDHTERKTISSVFLNRLKKKMKLQTDPSVIYGIENFDGNLTKAQLLTDNPYNTYKNFGLPPTPIANPGLASIMAAVEPAKTAYIYFVAKGNGKHKFSTNYRDHRRAVDYYQKRRRKKDYRSF